MARPVPTGNAGRRPADEAVRWNGTNSTARTISNLVLVAAGLAGAYLVLSNPKGRRIAGRLVRAWLGASVPMYLLAETGRAWVETGRREDG